MAHVRAQAILRHDLRSLFDLGASGGASDAELLERFAAKDRARGEQAFAALVERHGPMVLGVCRRVLSDSHLAEDAFQATFLILARRAGSVIDRVALGAWLHRVALRVSLRAKVQVDQRRRHEREEIKEPAVIPKDLLVLAETRATIDDEINRLSERHRLPVILCCLSGLTHEQAAEQLRCPVGTVESRLFRARQRLKERLTRRGLAPAVELGFGLGFLTEQFRAAVPAGLAELVVRTGIGFQEGGITISAGSVSVTSLAQRDLGGGILRQQRLVQSLLALLAGASAVLATVFVLTQNPRNPSTEPAARKAGAIVAQDANRKAEERGLPGNLLSAEGLVVDVSDRPISGATVLLRESTEWRAQQMLQNERWDALYRGEDIPDVLDKIHTGDDGRFRFKDVAARSFPFIPEAGMAEFPWYVVVMAEGHGLYQYKLTPRNQRTSWKVTLPEEGKLHGRILEPGGKPVAGARVKVVSLGERNSRENWYEPSLQLDWSSAAPAATTGSDGHFSIRGLPRNSLARLVASDARHESQAFFAATVDENQPDLIRRSWRAYHWEREPVKVHTGEFAITLRTLDHSLRGRINFEDDGRPASGAEIYLRQSLIGLESQFSSRYRRLGSTDIQGRFRLDNLPSGKLDLHIQARQSGSAPLVVSVELSEEPKVVQRDFTLAPGLIVTGKVVDESTDAGIRDIEIAYTRENEQGQSEEVFGVTTKTGPEGTFEIVVPAGRGSIEALNRSGPPAYVRPPNVPEDEPPSSRAKSIEGKPGQRHDGVVLSLTRFASRKIRVVDPEGRPVEAARVTLPEVCFPKENIPGTTDAKGIWEMSGMDWKKRYTLDVAHPTRPLGARAVVALNPVAADSRPLEITLQPVGSVEGKVLDDKGNPLSVAWLKLSELVELGSIELYSPSGWTDEVGADGSFRLDGLLPEVEYQLLVAPEGHVLAEFARLTVKPNKRTKLPDLRLPLADQEMHGTVVDPRGKPVAEAVVIVETEVVGGVRYNLQWSNSITDQHGNFDLKNLPRKMARYKLAADRLDWDPEAGFGVVRVEATAGQNDVRIVLPDRPTKTETP